MYTGSVRVLSTFSVTPNTFKTLKGQNVFRLHDRQALRSERRTNGFAERHVASALTFWVPRARDAHVSWQGSRYSVPWAYAGRSVWVRESGSNVEVHGMTGSQPTRRRVEIYLTSPETYFNRQPAVLFRSESKTSADLAMQRRIGAVLRRRWTHGDSTISICG
jgi:hypothetical protein